MKLLFTSLWADAPLRNAARKNLRLWVGLPVYRADARITKLNRMEMKTTTIHKPRNQFYKKTIGRSLGGNDGRNNPE